MQRIKKTERQRLKVKVMQENCLIHTVRETNVNPGIYKALWSPKTERHERKWLKYSIHNAAVCVRTWSSKTSWVQILLSDGIKSKKRFKSLNE